MLFFFNNAVRLIQKKARLKGFSKTFVYWSIFEQWPPNNRQFTALKWERVWCLILNTNEDLSLVMGRASGLARKVCPSALLTSQFGPKAFYLGITILFCFCQNQVSKDFLLFPNFLCQKAHSNYGGKSSLTTNLKRSGPTCLKSKICRLDPSLRVVISDFFL